MASKCENCTEKCPQAERAHQAALGRMYATKEFIALLKEKENRDKPKTNADRIRAMTDEELADFLCGIAYAGNMPWCEPFLTRFCKSCPTVEGTIKETGQTMDFHECDFADGKCPHGSDIVWWLQQPAEGD